MLMSTQTAQGSGFGMTVAVPEEGWYAAPSVVPALRSPHELTAISNRPLQQVRFSSPFGGEARGRKALLSRHFVRVGSSRKLRTR